MERIIVATGVYPLNNADMHEVNEYLAHGWSVKSVTPQNTKDHMTVIFVLERNKETSFVGTYRSNPSWNGSVDYLTLHENGKYEGSFYGGVSGMWKAEGNTITLSPSDGTPASTYAIGDDQMSIIIGGRVFSI